jgi:ElaB/YqjD/DUF883 family membrane-anchored ribosome-binding protein
MNKQFKGEKGPAPEKVEDQKYAAVQAAMDEENKIIAEINKILESTPDRAEAEKIVLEKYAPQMEEAMEKTRQALDEWLETIKESVETEAE